MVRSRDFQSLNPSSILGRVTNIVGVGGMATRYVLSVDVEVSNTTLPAKIRCEGWFPGTSAHPEETVRFRREWYRRFDS